MNGEEESVTPCDIWLEAVEAVSRTGESTDDVTSVVNELDEFLAGKGVDIPPDLARLHPAYLAPLPANVRLADIVLRVYVWCSMTYAQPGDALLFGDPPEGDESEEEEYGPEEEESEEELPGESSEAESSEAESDEGEWSDESWQEGEGPEGPDAKRTRWHE